MGNVGQLHIIAVFTVAGALACGLGGSGCKVESLSTLAIKETVLPLQKRISYTIKNYCASSGNTLGDMFLLNASYVITGGQIQIDTDRDGVPDFLDIDPRMGLSPFSAFSTANGFGDLPIFATSLTTDSASKLMAYATCTNPSLDTDGDGLSDCAESIVLKTKPDSFDTDGDGIPDDLELRFGLNPLDPSDAALNPTGDGVSNAQKIRMQIPVRESMTTLTTQYAHQYLLKPISQNTLGQFCFDLKISNIPIVSVPNGNLIISYVIEKANVASSSSSTKLNRCCSVVPNAVKDGTDISVIWGVSPELVCPCPLALDLRG